MYSTPAREFCPTISAFISTEYVLPRYDAEQVIIETKPFTLFRGRARAGRCALNGLPALIVLGGSVICSAQACKAPDRNQSISTDRPSFTNASTTVPRHTLQFENGLNETTAQGQQGWDLPQTSVRVGITTNTELRITAPDDYWNAQSGSLFVTGLGDLAMGVKQQLGTVHGFVVSAMGTLSFPTGARSVSSHGYDTTLQLPWSHQLPSNWTAAGMFTVSWPTQNGQHNVTGQVTALFDRQLTKSLDAFAEYAGTFPGHGGPQDIVDFGTTYKLTNNQQVDFRGGIGLTASSLDHYIGGGYSFRFNFYHGR